MEDLAKKLIKYFKSLGIDVYTNTKARGHQGFFYKNRIDISKNTREERVVPTLLHEFAHFIHSKIEPDMPRTGGSLEVLFDLNHTNTSLQANEVSAATKDTSFFGLLRKNAVFPRNDKPSKAGLLSSGHNSEYRQLSLQDVAENHSTLQPFNLSTLQSELMLVTNFVDENSLAHRLKTHKEQVKNKSKKLETIIKEDYPKFMRSQKFREFDKYIKKSKARYLLKYDRVKFISPFFRHEEIFSIDKLEQDFPDMQTAFCAYIRLKSNQRKQAKISRRINYLEKYYAKSTELFARLVEGLYIDSERTNQLAPLACKRFFELLASGHYFELKEVFEILQTIDCAATF